jgi:siroheme synthase-like protein
MAYFPLFMDIINKKSVVVGGGKIALRKVEILAQFQPSITVIAPEFCDEMKRLEKEFTCLTFINRAVIDEDLMDADLVVAATDHVTVNTHISQVCKEKNIPINVVDVPEECTFIFPAIVKRDHLVIAVSTGGNSPSMAARIRKEIEEVIPEYYGELIELFGEYRDLIKDEIHLPQYRVRIYNELIDIAKNHGNNITKELIMQTIDKYKSYEEGDWNHERE